MFGKAARFCPRRLRAKRRHSSLRERRDPARQPRGPQPAESSLFVSIVLAEAGAPTEPDPLGDRGPYGEETASARFQHLATIRIGDG